MQNARPLIRFALVALTLFATGRPVLAEAIKVFILAGQSNMEGKAKMSLLEYQAQQPGTSERFAAYRTLDGKWRERDDVRIQFLERGGPLTVGYGSPQCIGLELAFGWTVGDQIKEPVLLIKAAWGGRSLWRDFRPPSAGLPAEATLAKMLADEQKRKPATTMDDIRSGFGGSYRDMVTEVNRGVADVARHFPGHTPADCQFAGFIWLQGWNDMINPAYTAEYETNMVKFIRDVRQEFHAPTLPFVIAQMGIDGTNASAGIRTFRAVQAAAAAWPEFVGNVALVKAEAYWDYEAAAVFKKGWRENLAEWNKVGSDYPYHYLGSPKTLCGIGQACAEAVLRLQKSQR